MKLLKRWSPAFGLLSKPSHKTINYNNFNSLYTSSRTGTLTRSICTKLNAFRFSISQLDQKHFDKYLSIAHTHASVPGQWVQITSFSNQDIDPLFLGEQSKPMPSFHTHWFTVYPLQTPNRSNNNNVSIAQSKALHDRTAAVCYSIYWMSNKFDTQYRLWQIT